MASQAIFIVGASTVDQGQRRTAREPDKLAASGRIAAIVRFERGQNRFYDEILAGRRCAGPYHASGFLLKRSRHRRKKRRDDGRFLSDDALIVCVADQPAQEIRHRRRGTCLNSRGPQSSALSHWRR